MIAECHVIPVGSRSAVTMTASSSSIVSAKILSWESRRYRRGLDGLRLDVDIEKLVKFLSETRDVPAAMRLRPERHTDGEAVIGFSAKGE